MRMQIFCTGKERAADECRQYLDKAWHGWEKLWVVYNVIMVALTLPCLWLLWLLAKFIGQGERYGFGFFAERAIFFGMLANVCFLLGPLAESCTCRVLRWRMGRARYCLLAAGLLFSIGIASLLLQKMCNHLALYFR